MPRTKKSTVEKVDKEKAKDTLTTEKKTAEQSEVKEKAKAKEKKEFFQGLGRRKESIARVRLFLKKGDLLVNNKPISEYFSEAAAQKVYEEPLRTVNRLGQVSGTIKVRGGGRVGQLGAVTHGISRALLDLDESFRATLSKKKLLTRDSRVKERRKYGHAGKARKMKQSPKR